MSSLKVFFFIIPASLSFRNVKRVSTPPENPVPEAKQEDNPVGSTQDTKELTEGAHDSEALRTLTSSMTLPQVRGQRKTPLEESSLHILSDHGEGPSLSSLPSQDPTVSNSQSQTQADQGGAAGRPTTVEKMPNKTRPEHAIGKRQEAATMRSALKREEKDSSEQFVSFTRPRMIIGEIDEL